jgi:hypothetical protein
MVLEHLVDHGPRVGEPLVSAGLARERRSAREVSPPAPPAAAGHKPLD